MEALLAIIGLGFLVCVGYTATRVIDALGVESDTGAILLWVGMMLTAGLALAFLVDQL